MPANSDEFIRNLYAYFGLPFSATSIPLLANQAIPAGVWTKCVQLAVNPPVTHDFVPIVDPVPSPFISFPFGASPDLSGAGYTVFAFGQICITNSSGSSANVYVTLDQAGFGDMMAAQIPTGNTLTVPVVLNGSTVALGGSVSLWVFSSQAVTLNRTTPIADHTGNNVFGTRITVFAYPVAH